MFSAVSDEVFWDRVARKYAQDPIKDKAGYEKTLDRTATYLRSTDYVFEFGCGTGTTALRLAPRVRVYIATDLSGEMIAIAREKAETTDSSNITFEKATLDDHPWPDQSFDVVLGFNALHMLKDSSTALTRIQRLLKPGGLFISKTPCLRDANLLIQWFVPLAQAFGKAPTVSMFSADDLRRLLRAQGFDVLSQEKHGSKGADFRTFFVARKPG